jgi:hypothetical protein
LEVLEFECTVRVNPDPVVEGGGREVDGKPHAKSSGKNKVMKARVKTVFEALISASSF